MPALHTSTWMPVACSVESCCVKRSTAPKSARSSGMKRTDASGYCARIHSRAAVPRDSDRHASTTWNDCRARPSAVWQPTPVFAPVTTATAATKFVRQGDAWERGHPAPHRTDPLHEPWLAHGPPRGS
eukprot:7379459-Prymnesium_polylepis.1